MFGTFVNMPPNPASASPDPPQPPPSSPPLLRSRQKKRSQVTRACDWCRVHRVKCDNDHPCSNCKGRNVQCRNSGAMKSATLPDAYREIERLRQRIGELELEKERKSEKAVYQLSTPARLHPSMSPMSGEQDLGSDDLDLEGSRPKRSWEGIHISTARSPQKTWYGASSLFYFIERINIFLTSASEQTHPPHRMLPNSASNLLDGPTTVSTEDQAGQLVTLTSDPINHVEYLSPTQEEYFLGLFWQSYYTLFPILDELEFKEHYHSLWVTSDEKRKPSALVDIVIALCMQHGMAWLPDVGRGLHAASRANVSNTDATIAGRWYYRRCQTLLSSELESPTISTLQCHILCSIYLCCGSFQNMSDNACGLAVRTASMLGLHLEPPRSMPRQEREMRKRLWWSLYVLETKMSMKLGRPFLLHYSGTTCSLPADDREIAMPVGSSFGPLEGNITWLTWNLHHTKLLLAARRAYTDFYDRAPDSVSVGQPIMERLEEWLKDVPRALKTKRENNGVPFSTDRSALVIEQFSPLWLQRQRLLLELMYHNLCTNLYRPSISFNSATAQTPLADETAMKCAAHAMALTYMMHQVLSSTSILAGWHEAFQWQWNAAMTLVGFVLAYPKSASIRVPRSSIDLSVTVFESFGNSFAVAADAANIMSELRAKIDVLIDQSHQKEGVALDQMQLATDCQRENSESFMMNGDSTTALTADGSLSFFDGTAAELTDVLAQSIDIFAADIYNDFDLPDINGSFLD